MKQEDKKHAIQLALAVLKRGHIGTESHTLAAALLALDAEAQKQIKENNT